MRTLKYAVVKASTFIIDGSIPIIMGIIGTIDIIPANIVLRQVLATLMTFNNGIIDLIRINSMITINTAEHKRI